MVMAACGALLSGLHYASQLMLRTLHELAFLGRPRGTSARHLSSLSTYVDCGLKYYLLIKSEDSRYSTVGTGTVRYRTYCFENYLNMENILHRNFIFSFNSNIYSTFTVIHTYTRTAFGTYVHQVQIYVFPLERIP